MKIAIFGAGGHGRTVAAALRASGVGPIVFLDHDPSVKNVVDPGMLEVPSFLAEHAVYVAIGDNAARRDFSETVLRHSGTLLSVLHPRAFFSDGIKIGEGSVGLFGAYVGPGAQIGVGCIVNTLAAVEHDCQIGDYVNVSSGAILGGGVSVGDMAFIGLNATILPKLRIGADVTIGAGAVVVSDVPDGVTVAGNPARVML